MKDFFAKYADRIDKRGPNECWPWVGSHTTAGYGNFTRYNRTHYAHRSSYESAKGSARGLVVRHACDNRPCVNPRHLLGGTQKQNCADAWERNRMRPVRGEAAGRAVLTEAQVRKARAAIATGSTTAEISRKLGVAHHTLHSAVTGKSWAHLDTAPVRKGTYRGERVHNAALTDKQAQVVRSRISKGERNCDIARELGISQGVISNIRHGRSYHHV